MAKRCSIVITPVDLFPTSTRVLYRATVNNQLVLPENGKFFKTRKAAQRAAASICKKRRR